MTAYSNYGGHSAKVEMQLLLNGGSLRVVQMGPDFLLVDWPIDHPPTDARIVMQVDDSQRGWNVRLPHGISAGSKRIAIGPSL
jgi:hypothetical protein